jgi:serine/threonine protein kinase
VAGSAVLAIELVRGVNLRQLVEQQGPEPPERVRRILQRLADAVDAAHRAGLVHRDLEPSNVMVDLAAPCRTAKLLDFGLVFESGRPPGHAPRHRWLPRARRHAEQPRPERAADV